MEENCRKGGIPKRCIDTYYTFVIYLYKMKWLNGTKNINIFK